MLSKILSKETCASCRNCCVFHERSRWETPVASKEQAEKIKKALDLDEVVSDYQNSYSLNCVKRERIFEKGAEPYRCVALDEQSGCMLGADEKPFECSLWPLRVMHFDGAVYITIARGCHAVDDLFIEKVNTVLEEGLKRRIVEEAVKNPDIIREGAPDYIKLIDITETLKQQELRMIN